MRGSKDPKWLRPMWEKKKTDTAKRVDRAVKELARLKQPVTFESIRNTVKSLFGVSISANTIQRNEQAYAVYLRHRTARRTSKSADRELARRLREASGRAAVNLRAKINRLRRESKDNLIERLLQLEEERKNQAQREKALREEIFRLHPAGRRRGNEQ
jgi:multidrug efflux pump subunit AcrB